MLIIAAGTAGRSAYQGEIIAIDGELTRVVEDFDRAVDIETLRHTKDLNLVTKETGKHSFSPSLDRSF